VNIGSPLGKESLGGEGVGGCTAQRVLIFIDIAWPLGDPLEKLYEALYGLRQDIGAISGCRSGNEEWLAEYGPSGDNGKGTRRALREFVAGSILGKHILFFIFVIVGMGGPRK
jgi:hypothetical protein